MRNAQRLAKLCGGRAKLSSGRARSRGAILRAMRLATFNVENLFERPRAMNRPTWSEGQPALNAAGQLNALINKEKYSARDKRRMLALLGEWGLLATRSNNEFLTFRRIRGYLFRTQAGQTTVVADGRADWVGWVDLKKEAVEDAAILNTARVIAEVNPDILVLVEVENRPALQRFVDTALAAELKKRGHARYRYNMVIDGNEQRGIDVGILSRYPISNMRSHITDRTQGSPTFSRDCPEFYVELPSGEQLVVLPNHFASKGSDRTGARRKVQASAVKRIYEQLRKQHKLVLVAGDLNDDPKSAALRPLLRRTDLTDAMALPLYSGLPGTYQRATAAQKIDYLLMSPALTKRVTQVDVFRKGFYAPTKWESFENITAENKARFQASDHHCVWAEVEARSGARGRRNR
jgi:endonuclease/exonuclease/phosphatase family metal-dependent hydrolase